MEVEIVLVGVARNHLNNQILLLKNTSHEWLKVRVYCSNSMEIQLNQVVESIGLDKDFVKPVLLDVEMETSGVFEGTLYLYYGLVLPPDLPDGKYSLVEAQSISYMLGEEDWKLIQKATHQTLVM